MFAVNRGGHGVTVSDRMRFDAPALAVSTAIASASGYASADPGATTHLGATARSAVATDATRVAWRPALRTLKRNTGTTPAPGAAPGRFA